MTPIALPPALSSPLPESPGIPGVTVREDSAVPSVTLDERVVVNAGIVLASTLARRLGIEALVDSAVSLGERPGAARPGRKLLSLLHAMLLGADSIDDCEMLRSGRTEAVLGHRPMAPSTLGTFLRAFTFGHVRQLDRVAAQARSGLADGCWCMDAGGEEPPKSFNDEASAMRFGPRTAASAMIAGWTDAGVRATW